MPDPTHAKNEPAEAERIARRGVAASFPGLWLVVISAFLPTVRSCGTMVVPVQAMRAEPSLVPSFGLPYLLAAMLGALTLAWLARGAPLDVARRYTVAALAPLAFADLAHGVDAIGRLSWSVPTSTALFGAALGAVGLLGAAFLVPAVQADGWPGWAAVLTAWAGLSWASPMFGLLASALIAPDRSLPGASIGPGGWLYLFSVAAALPIGLWACRPWLADVLDG